MVYGVIDMYHHFFHYGHGSLLVPIVMLVLVIVIMLRATR